MSLSPALTGAITGAIAGSAATVVTNTVLRGVVAGLGRLGRRVLDRCRDDHRAILGGSWPYHCPPDAGSPDVWVQVICAPSRALRKPRLDLGRALHFVSSQYPGEFPDGPRHATIEHGVEYIRAAPVGYLTNGVARVCSNGRLDLTLPVAVHEDDATGTATLDVLDLLKPINLIAVAANSPEYDRVFNTRPVRRGRRFDWSISVSIARLSENGPVPAWEDLRFPGKSPSRGAKQQPFCPPGGFASGELVSRRASRPLEELMRRFLCSFLTQNGYHDVDDAVTDVLAADGS